MGFGFEVFGPSLHRSLAKQGIHRNGSRASRFDSMRFDSPYRVDRAGVERGLGTATTLRGRREKTTKATASKGTLAPKKQPKNMSPSMKIPNVVMHCSCKTFPSRNQSRRPWQQIPRGDAPFVGPRMHGCDRHRYRYRLQASQDDRRRPLWWVTVSPSELCPRKLLPTAGTREDTRHKFV